MGSIMTEGAAQNGPRQEGAGEGGPIYVHGFLAAGVGGGDMRGGSFTGLLGGEYAFQRL